MITRLADAPRLPAPRGLPPSLTVGTWGVVGLGMAVANPWMFEAMWIGAVAPWALWWVVGFALVVAGAFFSGDRPDWRIVALAPAIGAALWFAQGPLQTVGERLRFESHLSAYEAVVAQARASPPPPGRMLQGESNGVRWIAEPGPPLRVAIVSSGGVADNWSGYVWDPSGAVGQARGWTTDAQGRQQYTAPSAIHELFGGDIVACAHMQGDWWACDFT